MGADSRIFRFLNIPNTTFKFVEWEQPMPNETFTEYGLRLIKDVDLQPDDVLIGMSMGGFMAQEIASVKPVKKVILVSSLRSGEKFQLPIEIAKKLHLSDRFSDDWLKKILFSGLKFSSNLNDQDSNLALEMIDQFDGAYFKWAIHHILNWKGVKLNCPVYHVHGNKDLVLPIQNVTDAEVVEGGTHLMVTLMPDIVSKHLTDFIFNRP